MQPLYIATLFYRYLALLIIECGSRLCTPCLVGNGVASIVVQCGVMRQLNKGVGWCTTAGAHLRYEYSTGIVKQSELAQCVFPYAGSGQRSECIWSDSSP